MRIEEYHAGVTELYQGEIIGEGLFSSSWRRVRRMRAYGMARCCNSRRARSDFVRCSGVSIVGREGSSHARAAFKAPTS